MIEPNVPPFVRVRGAAQMPPGTSRAVTIGRYDVALFNVDGEFYALENSCPHQGGPIADGWMEADTITCPWHGWCFNIKTGKMSLGDFARVRRFDVQRDGSDLLVGSAPVDER